MNIALCLAVAAMSMASASPAPERILSIAQGANVGPCADMLCGPRPEEYICASNRETYPNQCELGVSSCNYPNSNITAVSPGRCPLRDPFPPSQTMPIPGTPCQGMRCVSSEKSPVIGCNGVKYDNECELRLAICNSMDLESKLPGGKCYNCLNQGDVCISGGRDLCRNMECTYEDKPVCGSDRTTYNNACVMRLKTCRDPSDPLAFYADGICPMEY